jgi:putative hydrolase of the HAD superfamily
MSDGWDRRPGDGILFDVVNTLIEADPPVAVTYAREAERQGIALAPEVILGRFRRHFRDDEEKDRGGSLATTEANERERWCRLVALILPEVPDLTAAFERLWDAFGLAGSWRCYPDVGPALAALDRAGVPFAIASNFDGRLRGIAAGLPELTPYRDRLVISSEVGYRKPHPALYRAAMDSIGLPADRIVCIGDDPVNDYEGPRAAGFRAILLDRRGRAPAGFSAISGLGDLVRRFGAA